ncbi:hypothetical protein AVEN_135530-1 [Araneus ventricosus]|uniref:Uncharacterized protein n=1 Tax=Araneus ventricosus TaxID=182803 RepID=A0A4Y2HE96_ARAVE|nr:hypothetical protein AVEN_135530-1 [Araneus ventricosus]
MEKPEKLSDGREKSKNIRGQLNDSRHDSSTRSESEGHHRPRPNPSRRRYVQSSECRQLNPTLLPYPIGLQEPAYLSDGFSSTYSWCFPVGNQCYDYSALRLVTRRYFPYHMAYVFRLKNDCYDSLDTEGRSPNSHPGYGQNPPERGT